MVWLTVTVDDPIKIRLPGDLNPAWLAAVLGTGPVADFTTERIGTGQLSESHRVTLIYEDPDPTGPGSVVVKLAAADESSRRTGVALGLYGREVRFYAEVAPRLGGPVPACYHASFDREAGTFCLVLGDAGAATQGDEVAGGTVEQARAAVRALGRLHAPALADPGIIGAGWLNRPSAITADVVRSLLPGFLERYAERIAPEHRVVCERLAAGFELYATGLEPLPRGLVHGDYRLDNLLFKLDDPQRPVTVVDWQTVTAGPALTDLAYFLGCALRIEDRRAYGSELIGEYHKAIGGAVDLGSCLDGVRAQSFFGVMMGIISPMLVVRTERGDDMFMNTLARHAQQVIDSDALQLLAGLDS